MTEYETLFLVHPERGARMKELIEKCKKIIEAQDGALSQVEEWGLRDLAYPVEKQGKGFYTLLQYRSSGDVVKELERNLKLSDEVLRYLTVRLDEKGQIADSAASTVAQGHPAEGSSTSEPQQN